MTKLSIALSILLLTFNSFAYDVEYDAILDCIEEVELQHESFVTDKELNDMKIECQLENADK